MEVFFGDRILIDIRRKITLEIILFGKLFPEVNLIAQAVDFLDDLFFVDPQILKHPLTLVPQGLRQLHGLLPFMETDIGAGKEQSRSKNPQ